jgi:predicted DNA-binding ribbon-helix-helix protein
MQNSNRKSGPLGKSKSFITFSCLTLLLATGCAKGFDGAADGFVKKAGDTVGCQSFEEDFWNSLESVAQNSALPTSSVVQKAMEKMVFDSALTTDRFRNLSSPQRQELSDALTRLYIIASEKSFIALATANTRLARLSTLSALEMGDQTTPAKVELQAQLRSEFAHVKALMSSAVSSGDAKCSTPDPIPTAAPATPTPTAQSLKLLDYWKSTRHPGVYGALKTLAIAYQSCDAGQKPALTNSVPDVQGITITGSYPGTPGKKRMITDLKALLRTDYYLEGYSKPSSTCFEVLKNPLIYDYSGRPDTSNGTFNLFSNYGGTSVLGIDCSGYVFTSYAGAGLKMKKDGHLKASQVLGINSAMIKNPQSNGLLCLGFASFNPTESLKAGDLLASSGHVVMVETLGSDPFGIAGIKKDSDCKAANIHIENFDFTVIQSSTVKAGIGINRIQASDYFTGDLEPEMTSALFEHAVTACHAKLQNKTIQSRSQHASFVRHAGTPDCIDQAIAFDHESCIDSCSIQKLE